MIEPLIMLKGRGRATARTENNWARRELWPADDPEYIFMGHAIDRVGRMLFGEEWTGREPQGDPRYPAPLPPMSEARESIRAEVAMNLPRTRQHFRKGEILSYNQGDPIPELTEDEWAQADAERTAKRDSNAASHDRWTAVVEKMDWPLRRQDIDTYARRKDSTWFAEAEDKSWSIDDMEGRFLSLKLNPRAPADNHSADRGWIFFGRASFEAFMRRLQGLPPPKVSRPHVFNRTAEFYSLFDAVIWTATGGMDTTTGDIADNDLIEAGAEVLFPLLGSGSAALVTGFIADGVREAIPAAYWELARANPPLGEASGVHTVYFWDEGQGIEAEFTPLRQTKPKWTRLRIARSDLEKLMPKPKAAAAKNLIPHQKAFHAWLEAHVKASLTERTLDHRRDIVPWLAANAPSLSDRMVREIRKIILQNNPGHKWGQEP